MAFGGPWGKTRNSTAGPFIFFCVLSPMLLLSLFLPLPSLAGAALVEPEEELQRELEESHQQLGSMGEPILCRKEGIEECPRSLTPKKSLHLSNY